VFQAAQKFQSPFCRRNRAAGLLFLPPSGTFRVNCFFDSLVRHGYFLPLLGIFLSLLARAQALFIEVERFFLAQYSEIDIPALFAALVSLPGRLIAF